MPTKKKGRADGRCQIRIDLGFTPDGKRVRKSFYGRTRKEAQEKADEFRRALKKGLNVDAQYMTVFEWAQQWFEIYTASASQITRDLYRTVLNAQIIPKIGGLRMREVKHADIAKLYNSLEGYSKSLIQKVAIVTNGIFRTAIENGIIVRNPALGHKKPEGTVGERRALTKLESETVIKNWRSHPSFIWAMIMMLAGLRPSEMVALQYRDIDTTNGNIHIRRSAQLLNNKTTVNDNKGKTPRAQRDIPIFPRLQPVLSALQGAPTEHVYKGIKGGILTKSSLRTGWEHFCKIMSDALGTEFYCTPDDLRHTFATILFDAGVDLKTAGKMMGHTDAQITMLYTHLSKNKENESHDALKKHMEELFPLDPHSDPPYYRYK